MKRLMALLTVLSMLLIGCTPPDLPLRPSDEPVYDMPAVAIALKSADVNADPPTVTVTWFNNTDNTIYPQDGCDILRRDRDGFQSCFDSTHPYADANRIAKEYELAPHSEMDIIYDVSAYILPIEEDLWLHGLYYTGENHVTVSMIFRINSQGSASPVPSDGAGQALDPDALHVAQYLSVTVDRITRTDGYTTLDVSWHNDSDTDAEFGEPYDISIWKDGQWVSTITTDNAVWTMPAFLLAAGEDVKKEYTPDRYGLFDLSKAGRYRFSSDVSFTVGDTRKTLMLTAVFSIE